MTRRTLMIVALATSVFSTPARTQAPRGDELPAKMPSDSLDGPPFVTAKGWAVADGKTGKLLWGGNESEKRPIASTSKIMTALLVLQLAADDPKVMDDVITFSERAAKTTGSSTKLLAGDRVSVRELMFGLMLPSGNDAAVAFAEHFGSRFRTDKDAAEDNLGAFIDEMNRRAKVLKMSDTSYHDPNGLSSNNQSSARNLATLTWHAEQLKSFRECARTRRYTCEVVGADGNKRSVTWENTNRLLGIEGYDGVKTGTTTPAGACLVASGRRGEDHLIVVVLGCPSTDARYADARNLFRWAWRQREGSPQVPAGVMQNDAKKPLTGAIIVVDPGHGGQGYSRSYTGGTRGVTSGMTESELNLRVAVEFAGMLRENGATVHLTREANHRLSPEGSSKKDELHARIDLFEHYNPHFFLSVHHNAGPETRTGHTALYKHNAADDTLYESLATDVNNTLEGSIPGPKLKLIKGDYHILRETPIPGTISEAGFMTNKEFDELSTRPAYHKAEADSLAGAAVRYWADHKTELIALRERLAKDRAEHPRDPKTLTAISLNPVFRAKMSKLLTRVAPDGSYNPAKIGEYVEAFKVAVVTDPQAVFTVKGEFDGKQVRLTGTTSERKYHDQLIDLLVAMKVYDIRNDIRLP